MLIHAGHFRSRRMSGFEFVHAIWASHDTYYYWSAFAPPAIVHGTETELVFSIQLELLGTLQHCNKTATKKDKTNNMMGKLEHSMSASIAASSKYWSKR